MGDEETDPKRRISINKESEKGMNTRQNEISGVNGPNVHNELLCYVLFHFPRSTHYGLKKAVIDFYDAHEIQEAKKTLWDNCSACLPAFENRKSSPGRPAHEAEATDILNAWQHLDKRQSTIPNFYAINLDRLPKYGPEEIDLTDIVQRIGQMEAKMEKMDKVQARTIGSIQTLSTAVNAKVSYASAARPTNIPQNSSEGRGDHQSTSQPPVTVSQSHPTSGRPTGGTSGVQNPTPKTDTQMTISRNELTRDNDGFELPPDQRRRELKREKRKFLVGKKQGTTTLKAAQENVELFVFRIHKDVDDAELRDYIERENVDIQELECISHGDAIKKSYKLTIIKENEDKVLNENFWPEGIACRKFYRQRTKFNNRQNGGSI